MKTFKFLSLCLLAFTVAFTSCKEENPIDLDDIVEDGMYIKGEASPFANLSAKALLKPTPNEVGGELRSGFQDIYISLEKNKTFTLVEVEGTTENVYGQGEGFATVSQAEVADQMTGDLQKGLYALNGTAFTVPEDGLYHIAIDKDTKTIVIMPVTHWAIIGSATPAGWGESDATKMNLKAFSKDSMEFEATEVELRSGDFKFRHSGAWKQTIVVDPDVKLNTNYKGTMTAGATEGEYTLTDLAVGGMDNVALTKAMEGIYTLNAKWTAKTGMSFMLKKTGDVAPSAYPENLYMIGSSIGGWDWAGSYIVTMNPVHTHPHAFWAVVYIDAPATDPGFKFAPEKAWAGDFGKNGTATDGVYAKGGDNLTVATAGYYMVYVDLKAEKISVTVPTVYGIGDAFGGWTGEVPANLFVVDNTAKTITSPTTTAAGNIRMYTTCPLAKADDPAVDWWQMEFNVINSKIEYRGKGGDQAAVPVVAGKIAVLDFQAGTGTIQ